VTELLLICVIKYAPPAFHQLPSVCLGSFLYCGSSELATHHCHSRWVFTTVVTIMGVALGIIFSIKYDSDVVLSVMYFLGVMELVLAELRERGWLQTLKITATFQRTSIPTF
jgi:hypothetical protein